MGKNYYKSDMLYSWYYLGLQRRQRTCDGNPMGKNACSFLLCLSNLFHFISFKLGYVHAVLHMAIKHLSELTCRNGDVTLAFRVIFWQIILTSQLQCTTTKFLSQALRDLFFVLIVFIAAEIISCTHINPIRTRGGMFSTRFEVFYQ